MNLTLCVDMKGCPNRCKHCWIGHMPNPHLNDSDMRAIVDSFQKHFEKITVYSWLREPDYCANFRERWLADCELSSGNKPQRFELASFYKIVREPAYVEFLKEVGTKKVQLTLFGLEATTDRYLGRKGAFQEILKAVDAHGPAFPVDSQRVSLRPLHFWEQYHCETKLTELSPHYSPLPFPKDVWYNDEK